MLKFLLLCHYHNDIAYFSSWMRNLLFYEIIMCKIFYSMFLKCYFIFITPQSFSFLFFFSWYSINQVKEVGIIIYNMFILSSFFPTFLYNILISVWWSKGSGFNSYHIYHGIDVEWGTPGLTMMIGNYLINK